ncbi:MAG TPA: transcriptional coactivator p15/PC4 family protein [Leptospiraceae bacterium]|nr:transcriptional coactivator p15/PC4 family protein [Leptospiraceae bacterium]HMW03994.1 transcriptional coactivator p15/PC4 family protein [Leptospiraceae bacterium]HMX30884.1 transcriptional coactivator p15/PC4 family protein [Leptospiraceae bacterium]HMY29988.1 transcriptional coactivator p15/PC4 family protein [Leptospiraceae bacterium]HMZ66692.1 transcriptional coactivator p15/PC4 family protein [Leptospiraceae bacterium]
MGENGIIRDIDKGKGEIIRVEISEFKGKKLLNLRVWYTDANGEYKPTQKGIAIPPDLYEQVRDAINEAGSRF